MTQTPDGLTLTPTDEAERQALIEALGRRSGCRVDRPATPPTPFAQMTVHLTGSEVSVPGQVVHIAGDGEVAVMFAPEARDALVEGLKAAAPARPSLNPERTPTHADRSRYGASAEVPLWVKFNELSKPEKIRLARTGNAEARQQAARDRDPNLRLHLLDNPHLTPRELAAMIRAGQLNAAALKRVAERTDLATQPGVAEALVGHPATPLPQAIALVDRLPRATIRRIAKQGSLRMPIVAAARRRAARPGR